MDARGNNDGEGQGADACGPRRNPRKLQSTVPTTRIPVSPGYFRARGWVATVDSPLSTARSTIYGDANPDGLLETIHVT
jgi:hypothetical protein